VEVTGDTRTTAMALAGAAVDLANTDPARAERLARRAISTAGSAIEPVAVATRALGVAALARGDLSSARSHLERAVAIADGAGLTSRAGETRGTLAYALTLAGETSRALQLIDQATPMLQDVPAARLMMQRALVLSEIGRLDEAAAAFAAALITLREAGGDRLVEADVRTNRSIMHAQRGDWRSAESDLDIAEAIYTALDHVGRTALVAHNRGLTAAAKGDVPAALAAYDQAERRYRAAGRPSGLLPVERAETLLSALLVEEARAAAEDAVAEFSRQRNQVDLVQARLSLSRSALLMGDRPTARREAELARRSAHQQLRPGWAALADYLLLRCRWEDGERTDSLVRRGRRTVTQLTAAGWVGPGADARLILARVATELGRPTTARRQLALVRRSARDGPAELRARAWHAEALLRLSAADLPGARAALESGIAVVEEFQASMGATELRVQASGQGGELAVLGLALAVRSGRAESVLLWAERCRAGTVRLRPARPPDIPGLSKDLAELRLLVRQQSGDIDSEATSALLRRQAALELSVRARSRHARPNGTPEASAPSVAHLRAALAGRALVEFLQLDGALSAVVLTAGRLVHHPLGRTADTEHDLDALHYGLRRLNHRFGSPSARRAAAGLIQEKAAQLDAAVLQPLRADVGDAALVIVPTGGLHAMPWSVLPSCQGRAVSVAPSARLWLRAATAAAGSNGRQILVSGPGLPHAAAEVAALAEQYPGATLLTGRHAGVEAVSAALDGAEFVHLAAHGRYRSDNPQFSAIDLDDGPLTVYDLEGLRRAPEHVVLSACESGRPAVRTGDEVMGLAAALLALGSKSLIATVVPVPDDTTRTLMLRLHARLREGERPAAALAAAQRDLIEADDESRSTAAGFICLGAG
jgi:CHAT domain-containing protein/tetratricopeptide (TPR) repeat protein